jgi:hypothetical protein
MDLDLTSLNQQPRPTSSDRARSPNRLRYDSEIRLIQARFGGLEEIRGRLGLSRRKICQLLLVDPSAWTRWTAPGGRVPPHIYRALEWYLLLTEKDPRALMPIGTWSSSAFEDRFLGLETAVQKTAQARAGLMAAVFLLGAVGGAAIFLLFR